MKENWTPRNLMLFEKRLADDFEKGLINCPLHLSGGNETALLGIFRMIKKDDYVFSTHRNHYHYLLHGGDPDYLYKTILNKNNPMRSMNFQDPLRNFYTSAIVGGNCAPAAGVALGLSLSGRSSHVWCFVGDGALDGGHFWEAFRFVSGRSLPLTFIIEDNNFSVDSTKEDRFKNDELDIKGKNYNNIIYYSYERVFPHVGIGKHVTF